MIKFYFQKVGVVLSSYFRYVNSFNLEEEGY